MKILNGHINAFGKLKDFDFDFSEGLNTICQKNGYGKTTFSIFLKAMFYGMAKRGNNKAYMAERSKYMPWSDGVYGGWITIDVEGKTYKIVRTFAATPEGDTFQLVDLETGLVSGDYSKDIGVELFGVGSETFAITAFFAQDGLRGEVNDELRAGLTGANKFEYDLSSCSKAEKLISAALTQTKSQCPKAAEIDAVKRAKREAENLLAAKQTDLQSLQEELAQVSERHQTLSQQQKQIEEAYRKNMANQEKSALLQTQLAQKLQQKEELVKEKTMLIEESKPQSISGGTTSKNATSAKTFSKKFLLPIAVILFVFGVASIVCSFFVGLKLQLLLAGVGIILCGVLVIAYWIAKLVSKNQLLASAQQEALALQVKLSAFESQIAGVEKEILSLQSQIENLPQNDESNFEEQLSALHDLDKQKSVLIVEINSAQNFLQTQQDVLAKLESDLDAMTESQQNLTARIKLLQKTKEFLLQAKSNVSERYLQPMQQAFEELFSMFDADEKLLLDVNLNINQVTDVGLKETQYLSQGVQDLLSICRRFALLDKIFQKTKPFVILDDPFVNLDDKKLQAAKEIVQKYAQNFQIIYFCSHSRSKI